LDIINSLNHYEFDRSLYNLNNYLAQITFDPDWFDEIEPLPIPVTVDLEENKTTINILRETLLGIMAVYRYLNKMHPLNYNGLIFFL